MGLDWSMYTRPRETALPTREIRPRTAPRQEDGPSDRNGLIILVQFQDLPFRYSRDDFDTLINGDSPTSALGYFNDQWTGRFHFHFDITEPVTLDHPYSYYGENGDNGTDSRPAEMIRDACLAADADTDFSRYDNDGDGEVDNVFVFYAGADEAQLAGDDHIWSHQWYLSSAGIRLTLDGVKIDNYACSSELLINADRSGYDDLASIGTFCHEYTHTFGIPDLYDTNGDVEGYAEGLWSSLDLMDAGNYNNRGFTPPAYSAVERWFFSLSEGTPLSPGEHVLSPDGSFLYLETDREGEIFLLECRQESGWDAYIGGSGLLIYHIDHSADAHDIRTQLQRGRHAPACVGADIGIVPDCPAFGGNRDGLIFGICHFHACRTADQCQRQICLADHDDADII